MVQRIKNRKEKIYIYKERDQLEGKYCKLQTPQMHNFYERIIDIAIRRTTYH